MSTALATRTGRDLVSDEKFNQHVEFLLRHHHGMTREHAELIMDQALVFVATASRYSGQMLTPSGAVDPGWHALILDTRGYAKLCADLGGPFVHHTIQAGGPNRSASSVQRTMELAVAAGFEVIPELWTGDAADCNEGACDSDDGRGY